MKSKNPDGAIGIHGQHAQKHVVMEQEPDSDLAKALGSCQFSMAAPVKPSIRAHAMKAHVQPGPIGVTGISALKNVTVEFNHEHANVKTGTKVIVQVLQLMKNNAIRNHANAK